MFVNQMAAPLISLLKPVSLCLASNRAAGFQGRQPGRDLDHFHLLTVADDH